MLKNKIVSAVFLFCCTIVFLVAFSPTQAGRNNSGNWPAADHSGLEIFSLPSCPGSLLVNAGMDSLELLGNLIQHGKNDSVRVAANTIFKRRLREVLLQSGSFDFDSVKNISALAAPDQSFRIITWALPSYEGSYTFYGFIRTLNKKTGESKVTELVDSSYRVEKPEVAKLNADRWYGAVYYKIVVNKKNKKSYYTLLGWKGKNPVSTQKVIDVLHFSGNKPLFGFPLFKTENVYRNRLIFEYAAQAVMSLRYEESKKMIVFDHLSSQPKKGIIAGPDGTYDALKFKGGKWLLLKDVDIRTDWKPKPQPKEPRIHEAPVQIIK